MNWTIHWIPIGGLTTLMAVTRFHHFGDFQTLPDASLAVFFLAGLFVSRPWFFTVLLAEAGLIDYLAIHYGGVSSWCVTPAYLFLIPTYAAMWLGGHTCRHFSLDETRGLIRTLAVLSGVTWVAFLISNGSFYFFSGYFDQVSLAEYLERVWNYLPSYLVTTLAYTALTLGSRWLWQQFATGLLQSSHR